MTARTNAAAGLALLAIASVGAATAGVNRSGSIAKFSGVDGNEYSCTNSTSFVTMRDMSRTFTLPAGGTASVVVMFNAALYLSSDAFDTGFLRLTIDNQVVG